MKIHNKEQDFHLYDVIDLNTNERVNFVINADEEKGIVTVYERDNSGYIKFDKNLSPITKGVKGKFLIIKKEEIKDVNN